MNPHLTTLKFQTDKQLTLKYPEEIRVIYYLIKYMDKYSRGLTLAKIREIIMENEFFAGIYSNGKYYISEEKYSKFYETCKNCPMFTVTEYNNMVGLELNENFSNTYLNIINMHLLPDVFKFYKNNIQNIYMLLDETFQDNNDLFLNIVTSTMSTEDFFGVLIFVSELYDINKPITKTIRPNAYKILLENFSQKPDKYNPNILNENEKADVNAEEEKELSLEEILLDISSKIEHIKNEGSTKYVRELRTMSDEAFELYEKYILDLL